MDPKRKAVKTHKENEAIQFDFDINTDDFEEIASEMYKSGLIVEEDSRAVAKLLKVQVLTLLKDRKEKIAQAQAIAKEKELAKLQHALEQHHQMMYQQQQSQSSVTSGESIGHQQQQQQHQSIQVPTSGSQGINMQQQQPQMQYQNHPQIIQNQQQQQVSAAPINVQQTAPNNMNQHPQQQQQQQANVVHSQVPVQQQQIQQLPPSSAIKPPDNIQVKPNASMQQQQHQQPIMSNDKLPIQTQGQVASVPIANQQQTPSPIIHDQKPIINQQQQQQQHGQAMNQGDSGIGMNTPTPQSAGSSTASSTSIKKRRSNKSSERYPKLVVLSVKEEKIVECEMEVKPKTVTFKFDVYEVNPDEVAKDLVSKFSLFRIFSKI